MQHTFDEVLVSAMDDFKHSSTYVDEVSGTIEPYTIPVAAHATIVFFSGREQQHCTVDTFDLALAQHTEC